MNETQWDPRPDYMIRREEKRKHRKSMVAIALICSILGGMIGAWITGNVWPALQGQGPVGGSGKESAAITVSVSEDPTIAEAVAQKAMPSVVGISTTAVKQSWLGQIQVQGEGSGFVLSQDGYIVTNAHVVDGGNAQSVTVMFYDGEQTEGKVLWADPSLDLALVKVEKTGLVPAELGDSDKIVIGEPAIAIGNPLGLDFQRSVTAGIISGLNRDVGEVRGEGQMMGNYMDGLIQTDASINQGNSGGPLLNKRGEVIGINTIKITSGEGMGFSIPINTVKPIVDQVIKTGKYESVTLGITGQDVKTVLAQYRVNLGTDHGVVVFDILPGSPADRGGLKEGDIIVRLGEREISGMAEMKKALYSYKTGDQVDITLIREGREQHTAITF